MANKKITELNPLALPELSDVLPIVNNGETKKVSYGTLKTKIREGLISGSEQVNLEEVDGFTSYSASVSTRSNSHSPTVLTSDSTIVSIQTSTPVIITGMTLTPSPGSYLVNFNSQYTIDDTTSITLPAKQDVIALYTELDALVSTVTRTGSVYGNNEILTAGVYDYTPASTLNGKLTLNAEGDSTKQFIFRCGGTFTTTANSEIELISGSISSNVWFVSEGAASTGADSIFKGSILANQAAVSAGARTNFEGRLLTITGGNTIDSTTFTLPTGTSQSTLGLISSFTLFTGTGAVGNTGASILPQDVGTNAGAITGFATATVGGSLIPGGASEITRFSCGVYIDGILISNSRRVTYKPFEALNFEYPVILQTVATITAGQTIDVRASTELGKQHIGPRMSLSFTPLDN